MSLGFAKLHVAYNGCFFFPLLIHAVRSVLVLGGQSDFEASKTRVMWLNNFCLDDVTYLRL